MLIWQIAVQQKNQRSGHAQSSLTPETTTNHKLRRRFDVNKKQLDFRQCHLMTRWLYVMSLMSCPGNSRGTHLLFQTKHRTVCYTCINFRKRHQYDIITWHLADVSRKPVDVLTKHRYMASFAKLSNGVPPPLIVSTFNGLQIGVLHLLSLTSSRMPPLHSVARNLMHNIVMDCTSIIQTILLALILLDPIY